MAKSKTNKRDIAYKIVTDKIMEALENGTVPWHKPWNAILGAPKNMVSKRHYRGINVFMLNAAGFSSPWWGTFKQIGEKGGKIKEGEKASYVVYFNFVLIEKGTDKERTIPFLRYSKVFNLEQTEGIEMPTEEQPQEEIFPLAHCEQIVTDMPDAPKIVEQGNQACYQPKTDKVKMPKMQAFDSAEEYYSTLFHELTHSTGHQKRLNRESITDLCPFGSTNYSKEELIAEMGAAFLCGIAGIENKTVDNSAAYIKSWLGKLKNDIKFVVSAASAAQKAVDHILDIKPDYSNSDTDKK